MLDRGEGRWEEGKRGRGEKREEGRRGGGEEGEPGREKKGRGEKRIKVAAV
jgi:hypothetical protein